MEQKSRGTTTNSKDIKAVPQAVYRAFTDPVALTAWQAPGDMTAIIHHFDLRVGGGYEMSLFYPPSDKESHGKTSGKEDRFTTRFAALIPEKKIVQVVNFDSEDPAFSGEMIMEITFEAIAAGTKVTIAFTNIPSGIRPEDNEAGTASSLDKLAHYVEQNV